MARNILFIVFFVLFSISSSFAQDPVCEPDPAYADSLAGVYPGPYHPVDYPDGGIHDTACINHPFELVLTAVIRDSIDYEGLKFVLNHLQIEEDGLLDLPEGLDYACNPPNCKFESNTMGCMVISGTPLDINDTGTYDLKLKSEIVILNGLIVINDTLPNFLVEDSHYYLELEDENSDNCQDLSVDELFLEDLNLSIKLNPVRNIIPVTFRLLERQQYKLELLDLFGRVVKSKSGIGYGTIHEELDISAYNSNSFSQIAFNDSGCHFIRLTTNRGMATEKVLILRP